MAGWGGGALTDHPLLFCISLGDATVSAGCVTTIENAAFF